MRAEAHSQPLLRTSLYDAHVALGARMVPFSGWEMPLQYTSILAEVRAVRGHCGIFDVSHMGRIHITGPKAASLLHKLLAADVLALQEGRSRYSFLLNEGGGIIDDTILYREGRDSFILVCNAANRPAVLEWIGRWAAPQGAVAVQDRTVGTAMVAFQGPRALPLALSLSPLLDGLRPFTFTRTQILGSECMMARTGYTGEDGVEFILPAEAGPLIWRALQEMGAAPCGLGARDVLRLEAGLMLHGSDITPSTTPLEAGLDRFVSLDKEDFIGAQTLRDQKRSGVSRRLVGFRLLARGIPRHGYPILNGTRVVGEVTSGAYSPTLDMDIGMGYVALTLSAVGTRLQVDIRGRKVEAEVVPLPFYARRPAR
ncbi:MAG: glycine cleavage system aminomethyltransferase GcvT [Chloroflexi bacterium]|nr:glycine cleavage system aminomethyltransferase GcvT [Chloroflexota bacterium]